jgi:hypothetical protein
MIEEMYGDEDEELVLAVTEMPRWGYALAWVTWKLPGRVPAIGVGVGVGVAVTQSVWWGTVLTVVMATLLAWGSYCRSNYPSPWDFAIIRTKQPVEGSLRRAAMEGRQPPPERPEES